LNEVDRRHHASRALKIKDGLLQLLVNHVAVRDHHYRVKYLLLLRVMQIGKKVGRPCNRVCLAGARGMLNEVFAACAVHKHSRQ